MEVYEKKKIPKSCATCLYFTGTCCAHADRKGDWVRRAMFSALTGNTDCPSWYLDHRRYVEVPPSERREYGGYK